MKIRIWFKVAQTGPLGFIENIILLSLGPDFPRTVHFTPLHFTLLHALYLLKRKKHINYLYAFRKEQYIKNHFHYHCHNH